MDLAASARMRVYINVYLSNLDAYCTLLELHGFVANPFVNVIMKASQVKRVH